MWNNRTGQDRMEWNRIQQNRQNRVQCREQGSCGICMFCVLVCFVLWYKISYHMLWYKDVWNPLYYMVVLFKGIHIIKESFLTHPSKIEVSIIYPICMCFSSFYISTCEKEPFLTMNSNLPIAKKPHQYM